MLTHAQRIEVSRSVVDYITGRSPEEMTRPVPNCPGWTVFNAAVHVAKAVVGWGEMMKTTPDDTGARERGFAYAIDELPTGASPAQLSAWADEVFDRMAPDPDRECYFSMTGGPGNDGLWAWHSASELGVHRLDVESALGHDHAIGQDEALDAMAYVSTYVTAALQSRSGEEPGPLTVELTDTDGVIVESRTIPSRSPGSVSVRGPVLQVLLALWGRPHSGVEVVDGDPAIWAHWQALPSRTMQFGAWD